MKKRSILIVAIVLMAVGFSAVATTLYLNGNTGISSNPNDFDVYFSDAYENGIENIELIKDKTHISFTTDLMEVNDTYELGYEVTNASKNYDLELDINVPNGNEYIKISNEFDDSILPARTIRGGKLTITLDKAATEKKKFDFEISITVNAVERTSLGEDKLFDETPMPIVEDTIASLVHKDICYTGKEQNNTRTEGQYITYLYNRPLKATKVRLKHSSGSGSGGLGSSFVNINFQVLASNDGENFEAVSDIVAIPVYSMDYSYPIEEIILNTSKKYRYYKLLYVSGGVNGYIGLYGRINYCLLSLEFVR